MNILMRRAARSRNRSKGVAARFGFGALIALLALAGPQSIAPAQAAGAGDNKAVAPDEAKTTMTASGGSGVSTLGARFSPGSIKNAADAQRALDAARASAEAADRTYRAENARCADVFFVNACRDKARRAHQEVQQEVHRVEVEAHDVQRRAEAEARASARVQREQEDAKAQARHVDPHAEPAKAQRDARKAKTQAASRVQDENAAARRAASMKQRQEDARKADEQRAADAASDRAQREANVKALAQKQQDAALYAKRKEADRIENEKRRAKRRAEREANNPPGTDPPAASTAPPSSPPK